MTALKNVTLGIINSRIKMIGVLLILVLIGFFGYKTIWVKSPTTQYQTQPVEKGNIVSSITVSGQIVNANFIKITTSASGVISKVYVKDGDQVSAGQKIAEVILDPIGQQKNAKNWASYLSAKNSVDSAKATAYSLQSEMFSKWRTFRDLAESSSYDSPEERVLPQFHIAEKDWLAAEEKYKNQQSVVSQTQASLNSAWLDYSSSSSVITAPQAGKIGNIAIVEGMNVESDTSQLVAVMHSDGNPIASFNLSEADVIKVKIDQKTTIIVDAVPGKTFTGVVQSVNRIGEVSSGVTNYPVFIKLDISSEEILPHMAATANIIVDNKNDVLVVPTSAITTSNGQSKVRILRNRQAQEIEVKTGLSSDTHTEITSGLQEGEQVITGILSNSSGASRTGTSPFNTFGPRGFGGGR